MKKIIQLGILICFFGCSESIKELEARIEEQAKKNGVEISACLLYTSPSPRDIRRSRMPSSA